MIYSPLKVKDNVIGIIFVGNEKSLNYTAEDLKMLNVLASQAAFALENVKLNYIQETFGRYLSDDLVKRVVATSGALKLGGEKKQITIRMSDLRGFTSLAEELPPETVVAIISNYLKTMVDVIQKYNGTILEFIGDAISTYMDRGTCCFSCGLCFGDADGYGRGQPMESGKRYSRYPDGHWCEYGPSYCG